MPKYSEPTDLRLEQDEPFFIVRAKDDLCFHALLSYAHAAHTAGLIDVSRGVQALAIQFAEWRSRNAAATKLPD